MAEASLQLGNGNWAGKSSNLLAYHKVDTNFYADELTFTRASTGTIVNAEGLIEEVPYNVMPNSEPTSTGAFKTNVTFQATNIYGWNGIYYGDNSVRRIAFLAATAVVGQEYTFSAFVKMTDGSSPSVGNSATDDFRMWNGSATTSGLTITDVGGGIYRCSVVRVATSTANNVALEKQTYNSAKTFEASGFQLVLGSVPKPYYATTDGLDYPRIDYSNGCGSLLLEPQRTNALTYSSDFGQSFYIKDSGVSVGTTNNTSPSGLLDATKIDVINSNRIYANVASGSYVGSVFIKAGTFSYFKFLGGNLDLVLGTISGGTIENYGNGWYKVSKAITSIRPFQIEAYPDSTYSAHTTSGNYHIYGAQAELGTYPTSYIPTSGTATTRLADTSSTTGLSSVINSTEGVLYAELSALADDLSFRIISISDGTTNNNVGFGYRNSSNVIYTFVQAVINSSTAVTVSDITAFNKVAIKYKSGDFAMWINGVEVYTSATAFTLTGLNQVSFDNGGAAANFFGNVQNLMVFDSALTDTELAELTTI